MSDGLTVSVLLDEQHKVPVLGVTAVWDDGRKGFRLEGDVDSLAIIACAVGELHYLAVEKLFGFRIFAEKAKQPNYKFWWFFDDFKTPAEGTSGKLSGIDNVTHVASLNTAAYTQNLMMHLFDQQGENDPKTEEWPWDVLLEWMLEAFQSTSVVGTVVNMERLPDLDEPDELYRYVIRFQDNSIVQLSVDGWEEIESHELVVPVQGAKGKIDKKKLRKVRVYHNLEGTSSYH